jgi:hypothetical protein
MLNVIMVSVVAPLLRVIGSFAKANNCEVPGREGMVVKNSAEIQMV